MIKTYYSSIYIFVFSCLFLLFNKIQGQVFFEETSPYQAQSMKGGITWDTHLKYDNSYVENNNLTVKNIEDDK